MRILYIAPLVAGFQDILEGKEESKGLPSFIFPLKRLLDDGNEVDIILVSNYMKPINIQVKWIKNENIIANINNNFATTKGIKRWFLKIKSFIELHNVIYKALKYGGYDFVYCHGTAAYLGNILANRFKIRCGYRIYGVVNVAHDIKRLGIIKAAIKYPIYYRIFRKKKDFLLITDDGTDGDYVFKKFNPKASFPMYYLVNGVDKFFEYVKPDEILEENHCSQKNYIFHAGRISRIKRQDRIIDILHEVHSTGCRIHLFLAGHISDEIFYHELLQRVKKYSLEEYVHFLGPVERTNMQSLAHDAIATILFGDSSNQGNIFFECAIAGSIIITYPENSLKKYISNFESGFWAEDEKNASQIVIELLSEKYDINSIRKEIKKSVDNKLQSWNERIQVEVELIRGGKKR